MTSFMLKGSACGVCVVLGGDRASDSRGGSGAGPEARDRGGGEWRCHARRGWWCAGVLKFTAVVWSQVGLIDAHAGGVGCVGAALEDGDNVSQASSSNNVMVDGQERWSHAARLSC